MSRSMYILGSIIMGFQFLFSSCEMKFITPDYLLPDQYLPINNLPPNQK